LIASDRLFEIFDLQPEDTAGKIELKPENIDTIHFKDVSFRYGTRVQVFEKLNLSIEAGKVTAIVGESGCGKTTLAAILQNIYPLQSGGIYLGNRNLNMFSNETLRKGIAIVPQRIDLFSGNVIDNIAVGEFYPDMDRVIEICDQIGVTSFIEQLPNGFQTYLGENGASLSGGQKQRIAIARALYREPEILILDEATSSLDTTAERYVQKTIELLWEQKKTIIIIAHRLSTIMYVDKVVVLDQGKVVQEGTVTELSEKDGKFRDLFIKDYFSVATT